MKKLSFGMLLCVIVASVGMWNCANTISVEESIPVENEVDTSKLIDFKGLPVSHRFSTPVEELEVKYTETTYKKMYRKAQKTFAKKGGVAYKGTTDGLPDLEMMVEAVKNVSDEFPFSKIEEEEESTENDVVRSLEEQLKQGENILSEEEKKYFS